jgi:hypothetical protein
MLASRVWADGKSALGVNKSANNTRKFRWRDPPNDEAAQPHRIYEIPGWRRRLFSGKLLAACLALPRSQM